jgi:hypothetical protein
MREKRGSCRLAAFQLTLDLTWMWTRSAYLSLFVSSLSQTLLRRLYRILSSKQMAEHLEVTPVTIDTIAKFVIQPILCDWTGCTATVNSWFTLEKVRELPTLILLTYQGLAFATTLSPCCQW